MILDNFYAPDSRVENEINALIDSGYKIDLYCVQGKGYSGHEDHGNLQIFRVIPEDFYRPFSNSYKNFVQNFREEFRGKNYEILHCHDFRMLVLGGLLKKDNPDLKLIYDAHEYLIGYPYFYRNTSLISKLKGFFVWSWYIYQENKNLKRCDALITVSQTLQERLAKRSSKPCYLLRNIPPNYDRCVSNCTYWHDTFGLDEKTKVIIHTGNAHYSIKRLHFLFEVISDRNLALVFLGSNSSLQRLEKFAEENSYKNIYFHEQVPRKYVTYYCSQANFGLVFLWKRFWKSYWYALPNKMIDVSLSGIPVLTTGQPELKKFVEKQGNGISFRGDSKKELKKAIDEIISREDELKERALKVSKEVNWNNEKKVLTDLYSNISS